MKKGQNTRCSPNPRIFSFLLPLRIHLLHPEYCPGASKLISRRVKYASAEFTETGWAFLFTVSGETPLAAQWKPHNRVFFFEYSSGRYIFQVSYPCRDQEYIFADKRGRGGMRATEVIMWKSPVRDQLEQVSCVCPGEGYLGLALCPACVHILGFCQRDHRVNKAIHLRKPVRLFYLTTSNKYSSWGCWSVALQVG